jgi:hypothetical protein
MLWPEQMTPIPHTMEELSQFMKPVGIALRREIVNGS